MNVRNDTSADRRDDTATPERISVSVFTMPLTRDMEYTSAMVPKQDTNAITGVLSTAGMKGIVTSIDTAAPTDAPEDRPRIYGDARGLRNTACIAHPEMAILHL